MKHVCIVGYGAIGPVHALALEGVENAKLYAVCDIDGERRKLCAEKYSVIEYDNFEEMLKDEKTEFTLLINENGEYELVPYTQIEMADEKVTAFSFERAGKSYVTYWHNTGEGTLALNLDCDIKLERDLGKEEIAFTKNGDMLTIPAKEKSYLSAECDVETLREAFRKAVIK